MDLFCLQGDVVIISMMCYWLVEAVVNLIIVLIGAARVNDMVKLIFK